MTMQLETADAAADTKPAVDAAPAGGGGAGLAPSARSAFEPFGGGGAGQALPSGVTDQLGSAYGADVSGMRVHNDGGANAAADKMGAEAFSYGNDVYFGSGQYQPGTEKGDYVIAHEAAHVAQQGGGVHPKLSDAVAQGKAEVGPESDPAEADAAAAADAVTSGGSHTVSRGDAKIRRFSAGGHAKQTEKALANMGLNATEDKYGNSEVKTARSGNWERDLSQVVLPATKDLGLLTPIMPILNIISVKEFGREINLAEFGSYDPVEHMDNPTDLRADGAFKQGGSVDGNLDADIKQHETANGKVDKAENGGSENTGWAGKNPDGSDVDPRYAEAAKSVTLDKKLTDSSSIAFSVDTSGIPVYMTASKQMLKAQLHNSMRLGRKGNDGRGPRLFSSAVHIMQDYYAHSNFSEIAINILLREGVVEIADEHGDIQNFDYTKHGKKVLNTGIHGLGKDGVTEDAANLTVGPDGKKREVMTTGSFNLADTAASVLEEVKEKWMAINPFKAGNKEASKMVGACLDIMQKHNTGKVNSIGTKAAEVFNGLTKYIGGMAPTAAKIVEFGGGLAADATKTAGKVASGGLGVLNWANELGGGSANYFGAEQKAVEKSTNDAGNSVDAASKELAESIKKIVAEIGKLQVGFDTVHGLRNAQMWISENVTPIEWLAKLAEKIPKYGPDIAASIRTAGNDFKGWLEDHLGAWWNDVITDGVDKINAVIQKVRKTTNVKGKKFDDGTMAKKLGAVGDLYEDKNGAHVPKQGTGIAPTLYNPPSHTEIAKDHGDSTHGAKDGHADHKHDPASPQEKTEIDDEHEHGGEGKIKGGNDHTKGDDKHGHTHLGAWLAPIAEGMASAATRAIGTQVASGWDAVQSASGAMHAINDKVTSSEPNPAAEGYPTTQKNPAGDPVGGLDKLVDAIVDQWFAHPEDCRGTWEGFVKGQLKSARMGAELLKRIGEDLSAKKPGAPTAPEHEAEQLAAAQRNDSIGPAKKHNKKATGPKADDNHETNAEHYNEEGDTAEGHAADLKAGKLHGAEGHVCTDKCTDHKPHGKAGHQCNTMCAAHSPHGADGHMCSAGCAKYEAHGTDAHQCTDHCEHKAA